ncbi:hypothetical protein [Saccharopolyspora hattusasensis]|uniref:hypothetical protein n=1 Tax=Saccharopolyspora hattusasensis TaxID=1128679 RepID=UPI003D95F002
MSAIQIKNVPDDVRETLVEAAKIKGQSLQSYLLDALAEQAHLARNTELLRDLPVAETDVSMDDIVEVIRSSRGPLGGTGEESIT